MTSLRVLPEKDFIARILSVLRSDPYLTQRFGAKVSEHISEWLPESGVKGTYPRIYLNNINWEDSGTYTHWAFEGTVDFSIFSYGESSHDDVRDMASGLDALTHSNLSNDAICFVTFSVSGSSTQTSADGLTSAMVVTYTFRVTEGV